MGRQSRARSEQRTARELRSDKPTATVIHRKKLFGGRETAVQVHRKYAWGPRASCYRCLTGNRNVIVQLSYSQSPTDLVRYEPAIAANMISESEDGELPVWRSKFGPLVKFWVEYACQTHAKDVEIEAARLPSRILVEIDHGPEPDKTVVGVM